MDMGQLGRVTDITSGQVLSTDHTVRIWDTATGAPLRTLSGHTDLVNGVAVAPDGSWLATTSNGHSVRIWTPIAEDRVTLSGHTREISTVAISPNGWELATSSGADRTVRIWDAMTGECRNTFAATAAATAPNSTWLALADRDHQVLVFDAATGNRREKLVGHTDQIAHIAISSNSRWLATASKDGSVRIWDIGSGSARHILTGHSRGATGVAITPNGTWLATTDWDGTLRLWDAITGNLRGVLAGNFTAVAVAPDGAWLATASRDGALRLWDVTSGTLRRTLLGHTQGVTSVAIAPDGTWLATTGGDGTIRIWDTATGTNKATMRVAGVLRSVTIAPSGEALYCAGAYGPYRFNLNLPAS